MEGLAQTVLRARSTVAEWIKNYRHGGIALLIQRKHGGRTRRLPEAAAEQMQAKLATGRAKTAGEIRQWLEEEQHISMKDSAVYY
ncbi:MAG TPA: helix-turn-helix domain-containing protein [Armatimonadota bacterium]|nr:helix-turn-helix domain-containing protein [Armatimonadota bacterium]